MISEPKRRLLKLAASRAVNVRDAAVALGVRASNVSDVRNSLHRLGLVEPWEKWDDPIRLTPDGIELARD